MRLIQTHIISFTTLTLLFLYLVMGGESLSYAHDAVSMRTLDASIQNLKRQIDALQDSLAAQKSSMGNMLDHQERVSEIRDDHQLRIRTIENSLKHIHGLVEQIKHADKQATGETPDIDNPLKIIQQYAQRSQALLDDIKGNIASNKMAIQAIEEKSENINRSIRTNSLDISTQKSLTEGHSARIYKILLDLVKIEEAIADVHQRLGEMSIKDSISDYSNLALEIDKLWKFINIIIIFFIPLAFFYAYTDEDKLQDGVKMHDGLILAFMGVFSGYLIIGFGLMYGPSLNGLMGLSNPLFETVININHPTLNETIKLSESILLEIGVIMLAAFIIYSAVGCQLSSIRHFFLAFITGAIIIPVFGHWIFADYFIVSNLGWLQSIGLQYETNTAMFNLVAGWFAMTLLYKLRQSEPCASPTYKTPVYSSSTVLLLFIGWISFTISHLRVTDDQVSVIVLNIIIAAIFASIFALLQHAISSEQKNHADYALGGFVSGLVAIAACAPTVTLLEAMIVGAIAGSIHNIAHAFLKSTLLAEPWQNRGAHLVAIHGISSIWGILCVGLLGSEGNFGLPNIALIITQLQGIGIAITYSLVSGLVVASLITANANKNQN
jgi:ammonia channel protein AmtB